MKIQYFIFIISMLFVACTSSEEPVVDEIHTDPIEEGLRPQPVFNAAEEALASGQTAFGPLFLQAVNKEMSDENLVVSPLSTWMFMSMLANAADDAKAQQICKLLGTENVSVANSFVKKYTAWLPGIEKGISVGFANSMWTNKDYTLEPSFANILSEYYGADCIASDFRNGRAVAAQINSWTRQKTNGLIDNIIGHVSDENLGVLVNALYFKGIWTYSFNEKGTAKDEFHGKDRTSPVDMMQMTNYYKYASTKTCEILNLPFGENKSCSMILVLPKSNDIDGFIASADFEKVLDVPLESNRIFLSLPKLEIAPVNELPLDRIIKNSFGIDMSSMQSFRIFTENIGYPLGFYQKAGISLDENGTKAAAVSWVHWDSWSGSEDPTGPIEMKFDRPFCFFIVENNTGLSLFAGKVVNL